jgi:excisionase family DNA binding protein
MTLTEAASILRVQPATLRQQIANGKLKATKRGRDWWVTKREVDRYRAESRRLPR